MLTVINSRTLSLFLLLYGNHIYNWFGLSIEKYRADNLKYRASYIAYWPTQLFPKFLLPFVIWKNKAGICLCGLFLDSLIPKFLLYKASHIIIKTCHFSHSVVSDSLQPQGLQHARLPCTSPTPRTYSNSHPSSQWCHPTISSSVVPFSPHLQYFPASGSYQKSQFFASGGQSIWVLASVSVFPMNIQYWFPTGLTGWISFQSKGLSRIFSNTTVRKHQLFGAQLSL